VNQAYWARNPQGPFATLIAVAATYCHPEVYNDAYPELIERVRSAAPEDEQIRVFREELREALADPSRLPDDELSKAVQYDDGSSQAFLRRLWHDLYGDEPAAGA
jgi:hypothetical protein